MTEIRFITSFNEDIYKNIGHHFLKSITEQWEPSLTLTCFHHNCSIESYKLPNNKSISYRSLHDIKDYEDFVKESSIHDGTEGGQIPYNIKLDTSKWCHKVFALTEYAFELVEKIQEGKAGWLIWIDADSFATRRLVAEDILAMLPEASDIAYSGMRKFDDGTECIDASFMAFNLSRRPALDLLNELRKGFISGEVFQYREWHDAFIIERLINIYKSHGLRVVSLDKINNHILHFQGSTNPASLPLRDSKGQRLFKLSNVDTTPDIIPNRYKQISELIRHFKPKSLIEVGTWNGGRAIEMILSAFENHKEVHYQGFDLFEDATTETDIEEFNVKAHNTLAAVEKRFKDLQKKLKEEGKTLTYTITKGNSRDTLPKQKLEGDFAFIGGGNSIKTVASDYECLKHIPIIMFDHYFLQDKEGNIAPKEFHGANKVVDKFKKKVRHWKLPSGDMVRGGGHTHLVLVVNNKDLPKVPDQILQVPIVVNPRDCVPKDYIRNNIKTNMTLIDDGKWLGKYPFHKEHTIIVSGGPYINFDKVKECINKYNGEVKVICVKHSYKRLLDNGIKPWGCIVLDPRSIEGTSTHGIVRKDLFEIVDPSTKFFVASMTDPSVTKYLQSKDANIWGWHAFTESLRDPEEQKKGIQNNQVKINEELGIPQGSTLITGGTCAAMRAIGIMHTMGFRRFDLFGFDSCMDEPTEEMKKETTGAEDEEPRPKYFQVGVKDKNFWTTGELLAMAQDCERTFNDPGMEMDIELHGENTLVSALWDLSKEKKGLQPTFKDTFNE